MNPCQPWPPVSYVVYHRTNPLAYYFFGERWRVGDGLNGDGEDYGARHVHEVPSNNEFRGMRWILNRAKKFNENEDNHPYIYTLSVCVECINTIVLMRDNWKCTLTQYFNSITKPVVPAY